MNMVADLATMIAAIIAAVALIVAVKQLKIEASIAKAKFLLDLEKLSERFDEIHMNCRPGGKWSAGNISLNDLTLDELIQLEDYMGFFEHCHILISKGVLSLKDFRDIFGYRINNLYATGLVEEKVSIDGDDGWRRFISIFEMVNEDN